MSDKKKAEKKKKPASLQEFLAGLSPKERMLLNVTVTFVALALVDRTVIAPIIHRMERLDERIAQQTSEIRDGLRILGYREKIEKENDELSAYMVTERLSQEEELAALLSEVENIAMRAGVQLVSITPAGEAQGTHLSAEYRVLLDCVADTQRLMQFMYAIEAMEELIKIDKFEINSVSAESNELRCSMTVSRLILLGGETPAEG